MKYKLFIFITFLIMLIGCIPTPKAAGIQSYPISPNKLQITYIRNEQKENFGKLYAIDITCMTQNKVCFGEPKLLFQSLKMPSQEQKKPRGFLTDYSWSPDGNNIAITSVGNILIGDVNTQDWVNITTNSNVFEHKPKFSNNGKFIYYLTCPRIIDGIYGGHGDCHLYSSELKGKEESALLGAISHSIESYDISSNQRKVVFTVSAPSPINNLLYQANWDGTNSYQMTTGNVSEKAASFSPDGQKVVFTRSTIQYNVNSKDESDIIVKDLNSGEEKNLTKNFDGLASSPTFSLNGKWGLFYSFDIKLN